MKKANGFFALMASLVAAVMLTGEMAQAQVWEEWVATYNGPTNLSDLAWCLDRSAEGPIFVSGGGHGVMGGWDIITVMYNSSGAQQWVDLYDGPAQGSDVANDLIVDEMLDDYSYAYVTGFSEGIQMDFVTLKYNTSGHRLWVQRYDGPAHGHDEAVAIAAAAGSDICVTGYSEGNGTDADFLTIQYSQSGAQQWVARYDGGTNHHDEARCLTVDNFGNVFVAGRGVSDSSSGFDFDGLLVKYNSAGVLQWTARYDGPEHPDDCFDAIEHDQNGNIYVAGTTTDNGADKDYLVVKYNASGQQLWAAIYGDSYNDDDEAWAIGLDQAANVFVTGYCKEYSYPHCTTIKYSSDGAQLWVQSYAGLSNESSWGNALRLDYIGNVYVTGSYGDPDLETFALTLKYSSDGVPQWSILYDSPDSVASEGNDIVLTGALDLIVTGSTFDVGTLQDYLTIQYSQTGPPTPVVLSSFTAAAISDGVQLRWQTASEINCYGWFVERRQDEDGYSDVSSLIPGYGTTEQPREYSFTDESAAPGQTYIYRLEQIDIGGSVTFCDPITITLSTVPLEFRLLGTFPNPFNATAVIRYQLPEATAVSLVVFDLHGQRLRAHSRAPLQISAGVHEIAFDGSDLPSGIYIYRLEAGEFEAAGKMVHLK